MINETRLRVRYAETDQMGVVYHANHFIWFEVGRVELLRQLGFSYKEMEQQDNCFIAVVDARCRYKAPVRYDDEILVRTWLRNIRESVIHFGYELVRVGDGALLAEQIDEALVNGASTVHRRPLAPSRHFVAAAVVGRFRGEQTSSGRHSGVRREAEEEWDR